MSADSGEPDQRPGVVSARPLRSPDVVMRLDRMGSAYPTRLSFGPALLRHLARAGATVVRSTWGVNDDGFGCAVYEVHTDRWVDPVSLVAFSAPLPDEARSDRVIASAWDASFVLFDGRPDQRHIARLAAAVPRQEAARYELTDLVLSRANRSVRLFDHVVDSLSAGHQPDEDRLAQVGYLMRTTAVYGNGKFGIADRHVVARRPLLEGPFRAEMLTVWLIREFTVDLVELIAGRRSATAVELERRCR